MRSVPRGLLAFAAPFAFAGAALAQQPGAADERSCAVCHPGAVRALRQSPHGVLLARQDTAARACAACHGDLAAHAAAQARPGLAPPPPVSKVAAAACAVCHPGRDYAPPLGSHPAAPVSPSVAPLRESSAGVVQALAQQEAGSGFRWSGLADFGYRLVHVAGSRDRYATDIDLEPGPRLRTFEQRGTGGKEAIASALSLVAHDLGDPRWDVEGRAQKDGVYDAGAGYRRDSYQYRASGDFHRVDRDTGLGHYDAEVNLTGDVRLFGSFARTSEDGFWLTQRLGNTNVSVQSFVDGVESPRRYDGDVSELGLLGDTDGWKWRASADYLDERTLDHWSFSRPAPANPLFDESEDFSSQAGLHGPGGTLGLSRDLGSWSIDLTGRYVHRERSLSATGQSAGFDIAQFTTATDASGEGTTRTWLFDGSSSAAVTDEVRLQFDLHWRDHSEDLVLRQTDVTTYPTLGTVTTVVTNEDQHTAQRLLEGAAGIEWSPAKELELTAGYGFAREELRVPDLDPSDPRDFRHGTARDNGVLAGARWKPDKQWTVRGDVRDFGQDGVPLHELAPARDRLASGSVGYDDGKGHATVFVRHRYGRNDVSQHLVDSLATGLQTGIKRESLSFDANYTFARIDSRTLTNFYFDPDPNPQPTFVGFEGDTHTVIGTLGAETSAGVHWELTAVWTTTTGSFDVSQLDWRAGLRCDVGAHGGAAGLEFRQVRYRDQQVVDDYDAALLFLYWRQTW